MKHMIAECLLAFNCWYKVGYYMENHSIPKRMLFSTGQAIKTLFEMIAVDLEWRFRKEDYAWKPQQR